MDLPEVICNQNVSFILEDLNATLTTEINKIQTDLDNIADKDKSDQNLLQNDEVNEIISRVLNLFEEIEEEKIETVAEHFIIWSLKNGITYNKFHSAVVLQEPDLSTDDLKNSDKNNWKRLSMIFHNIWCKKLIKLSTSCFKMKTSYHVLHAVNNLCFLLEEDDVWTVYKNIRQKCFLELSQKSSLKIFDFVTLVTTAEKMIQIDVKVINECFSNIMLSFDNLQEMYLETLCDWITTFISAIRSSLFKKFYDKNLLKQRIEMNSNQELKIKTKHDFGHLLGNISLDDTIDDIVQLLTYCWKMEIFANNIVRKSALGDFSVDKTRRMKMNILYEISTEGTFKNEVWEWRTVFDPLMKDLLHFIDKTLHLTASVLLEEEWKHFDEEHQIHSHFLCKTFIAEKMSSPKAVSPFIFTIVNTMNKYLPVAICCNKALYKNFQTTFISSINDLLIKMINHFKKLSQEVIPKCLMKNVYVLISSAVFLKINVEYYAEIFKFGNKGIFQSSIDKLNEFINSLIEQTCDYSVSLIKTTILQNKDCHNWKSNKPFFENERISFSIQMWNVSMRALQHELWTILPLCIAQKILFTVFENTLAFLVLRYSTLRTNFAHVEQVRSDITAILICSAEFLLKTCTHSSVHSIISEAHYKSVHNMCSTLLSTLIIITSPLNKLFQRIQKEFLPNFAEKIHLPSVHHCNNNSWISVFCPDIFPSESHNCFNCYSQLELINAMPYIQFSSIVQVLMMEKFRLSIQMILHSDEIKITQEHKFTPFCTDDLVHCECSYTAFNSLADIVICILTSCQSYPLALGNVLLRVIKRDESWGIFFKPVKKKKIPHWFQGILNLLDEVFTSTIQAFIQKIYWMFVLHDVHVLSNISSALFDAFQDNHTIDMVAESFKDELIFLLQCLPSSLKYLFTLLNVHLPTEYKSQLNCDTLVIQIITLYLDCLLISHDKLEELIGITSISKKQYSKFIFITEELLDVIRIKLSKEILIWNGLKATNSKMNELENIMPAETDEQFWQIVSLEITQTENGTCSLIEFYKILKWKKKWIENLVQHKSEIKQQELPHCLCKPTLYSNSCTIFNPFINNNFGLKKLDQQSIIGFPYDWDVLLQKDFNLTKSNFHQLLCNRWEMKANEELDENEKELVFQIKNICKINSN